MKPRFLIFALAVALLTPGSARAAPLTDGQASSLAKAFKALDSGYWHNARHDADAAKLPLARDLVEWLILTDSRTRPKFDELDAFLSKHPDWPSQDELRRRAEEAMPVDMPTAQVRAWFGQREPLTTEGGTRLATALIANDDVDAAIKLIRDIWINGSFGARQERQFYRQFRKYLTKEDHIARLDHLPRGYGLIGAIMKERRLKQVEVAGLLGIGQPDVSK